MNKKWEKIFRNCVFLVLIVTMLTLPVIGYGVGEEGGSQEGGGQGAEKPYKIPNSVGTIRQAPRNPGAGTVFSDVFDPTATHTGKLAEKTIKAAGTGLEKLRDKVILNNMVPKDKRAAKSINLLVNKQKNIAKNLAKSTEGTKGFRHWDKALKQNMNKIQGKKVLSGAGKAKSGAITAGKGALRLGGLALDGYSIYTDIQKINKGEYTHNHKSMRFISDALRSASIAANSFSMAQLGKNPIAGTAALITGVAKDIFESETFSTYMNNTDNVILRTADDVADGVNSIITSPTAIYIPELLITKWSRFWGTFEEEPDYEELEEIHQKWLAFKESDEYKERIQKLKLKNRPGNDVPALKPNIYLYPEETMEVGVYFDLPALLEIVIPDYHDEWLVVAQTDGTLIAEDGEEYRFLFYESLTWPFLFQKEEGWLIKGDRREEQFDGIMRAYGFTDEEVYDFVEFWTEKLDIGDDYIMYPQLTEVVDVAMPMKINPEPDTLFRLWFLFKKDGKLEAEATVEPIIREGFTVIEWGGVILE